VAGISQSAETRDAGSLDTEEQDKGNLTGGWISNSNWWLVRGRETPYIRELDRRTHLLKKDSILTKTN